MRRALVGLAALVTLAGCGTNSNGTGSPGGVAEDYLHDLADRDYSAACQLLTDDLRHQLGDCPSALAKRHGDLPVTALDELRLATVDHVTYRDSTTALVYAKDIKVRVTATVKVNGTPKPRSSAQRSIAANEATDGHGLELRKTGTGWRISGGGV